MVKVWAPRASLVELETNGELLPLEPQELGWWSADQSLEHGQDYSFRLDGRGGFPDPRSPWQPTGVHQPSRHVDHSRFPWSDTSWQPLPLSSAVIYELHVGTFSPEGTFQGVVDRLDYLVELGITHIELMPVASFLGNHGWGYDGVALFAPHEPYGGPSGLKQLVDACHAKGIAVLLDVVYNHLGPSGNYLPQFGPYFTEKYHTTWGSAVNVDGPDSDEVRRFFCDNALMWLRDYHIDGLRLDAVHTIFDSSALPFLEQLAAEVDQLELDLGQRKVLIAETDSNDPRLIRPREGGGLGIDAQWADEVHHSLHSYLTGEQRGYYTDFGSLEMLATSMQQPFVFTGQYSKRRRQALGRRPLGALPSQFVVCTQNHDQIGNRAWGERLCHLVSGDRVKMAAALILLSPYVPLLFQGEEWSASTPFLYFVDFGEEPELAQAVVEGRRAEFASFGWEPEGDADPTSIDSFLHSKLRWNETSGESHADMLAWYRSLISLRRSLPPPPLHPLGGAKAQFDADRHWLVVHRDPATILCNFSDVELQLPVAVRSGLAVLLSSKSESRLDGRMVTIAPQSVVVVGPRSVRTG